MTDPVLIVPQNAFPPMLREIPEPPKQLYYRGSLPDFSDTTVKYLSIVGSRKCTTYGKQVVEALVAGLQGYPIVIVSGLAYGIDALAHEHALKAGLRCIAVPGSGLEERVLYPRAHTRLAKRIIENGGCLLSEFEPSERAAPWTFPRRNRIMVGLSHAVLMIEASEKSGTLITARLAVEYNRELLGVPGSVFSNTSSGVHQFLKLGATLVTSSHDIFSALKLDVNDANDQIKVQATSSASMEEQEVLDALTEPLTKDALASRLSMSYADMNRTLSSLELSGLLMQKAGLLYKK